VAATPIDFEMGATWIEEIVGVEEPPPELLEFAPPLLQPTKLNKDKNRTVPSALLIIKRLRRAVLVELIGGGKQY
jgi:hypothetical protein